MFSCAERIYFGASKVMYAQIHAKGVLGLWMIGKFWCEVWPVLRRYIAAVTLMQRGQCGCDVGNFERIDLIFHEF